MFSNETLWKSLEQADYKPRKPLEGKVKADIAVVGAGIAGLSTAYFLKDSGMDVVVLDKGYVGSGSTGRSGGTVVAGWAAPYIQLLRKSPRTAKRLWESTYEGKYLLKGIAEDVGSEYETTDCLALAKSRPVAYAVYLEALAMRLAGYKSDVLSESQLRREIGDNPFKGAIVRYDYGSVNPLDLTRKMAVKLDSRVGIHENTEVKSIIPEDGGILLTTENGEVKAKHVVLATNAYTPSLELMKDKLYVYRAHIAATEPVERRGFKRTMFTLEKWYSYLHGANNGSVLAGTPDEDVGNSVVEEMTSEKEQRKIDEFLQQFGLPVPSYRWAGLTAYTDDERPIIGRAEDGLFYNIGCNGVGLALLTLGGFMVSEQMHGRQTRYDELFTPYR